LGGCRPENTGKPVIHLKKIAACLAVVVPAFSAQAYPRILKSMEEHSGACSKYSTADARDACKQKSDEDFKAFDRHLQQEDAKYKASQPQFKKPASDKPSGLCFTRRATGEVVCPN
jgi:hypothetical protein